MGAWGVGSQWCNRPANTIGKEAGNGARRKVHKRPWVSEQDSRQLRGDSQEARHPAGRGHPVDAAQDRGANRKDLGSMRNNRLVRFRTWNALTSVLISIVLALSLLLLSQGVSSSAPRTGDNTPPTV